MPPSHSGTFLDVWGDVFHGGEFHRLVVGDRAGRGVTDEDLERCQHGGQNERDREPSVVIAVAPAVQDAGRVHPGDGEPGHHVGGQDHVRHLVGGRVVEEHAPGVDGGDLAVAHGEAAGLVHPRVDRDHRHRAKDATQRDRRPAPPVRPATQPPPPVEVDPGEDRFEEEEQPLDPEGKPQHHSVPVHQPRPQQAHLERKHRPGHRADRDQHPHRLRPAPRQPQRHLIRSAEADELSQQHDGRQRDTQASQDDVKPERGRHLRTGRNHLPVHLCAGHQGQPGG